MKLSDKLNSNINATKLNLIRTVLVFGDNPIGLMADDALDTINQLIEFIDYRARVERSLTKVLDRLKIAYRSKGGTKEELSRIYYDTKFCGAEMSSAENMIDRHKGNLE